MLEMTCFTLPIYHEIGGNAKHSAALKIEAENEVHGLKKALNAALFETQYFLTGKWRIDTIHFPPVDTRIVVHNGIAGVKKCGFKEGRLLPPNPIKGLQMGDV